MLKYEHKESTQDTWLWSAIYHIILGPASFYSYFACLNWNASAFQFLVFYLLHYNLLLCISWPRNTVFCW